MIMQKLNAAKEFDRNWTNRKFYIFSFTILTYMTITELIEAKFISQFCCWHGIGQILFVGKHEQHCIS